MGVKMQVQDIVLVVVVWVATERLAGWSWSWIKRNWPANKRREKAELQAFIRRFYGW